MLSTSLIITVAVLNAIVLPMVNGHGMIIEPASRASRWRYGFAGPREYTDNELSCGGRNVQWGKHKGKCGVCGDEYGLANPKFVYPGAFAKNPPIVKVYFEGERIVAKVKITANHKGYFIFRVAPLINPPIRQGDLDKTMLELDNGNSEWQLLGSHGTGVVGIGLRLPKDFTCQHCVLQWWWSTGNNHVNNKPETFVNCADIEIRSRHGQKPSSSPQPQPSALPPKPKPSTKPTSRPSGKNCRSLPPRQSPSMDKWCRQNCARGYCPPSICVCV